MIWLIIVCRHITAQALGRKGPSQGQGLCWNSENQMLGIQRNVDWSLSVLKEAVDWLGINLDT